MTVVVLRNLRKSFGSLEVIKGVDLEIENGEFCVFVGPSGCGKSTLLRQISGLEAQTSGTIEIGGRDVSNHEPSERGIAMVFQNHALYPHLTVRENIGFGLSLSPTEGKWPCKVRHVERLGADTIVHMDSAELGSIVARVEGALLFAAGQDVFATPDTAREVRF